MRFSLLLIAVVTAASPAAADVYLPHLTDLQFPADRTETIHQPPVPATYSR